MSIQPLIIDNTYNRPLLYPGDKGLFNKIQQNKLKYSQAIAAAKETGYPLPTYVKLKELDRWVWRIISLSNKHYAEAGLDKGVFLWTPEKVTVLYPTECANTACPSPSFAPFSPAATTEASSDILSPVSSTKTFNSAASSTGSPIISPVPRRASPFFPLFSPPPLTKTPALSELLPHQLLLSPELCYRLDLIVFEVRKCSKELENKFEVPDVLKNFSINVKEFQRVNTLSLLEKEILASLSDLHERKQKKSEWEQTGPLSEEQNLFETQFLAELKRHDRLNSLFEKLATPAEMDSLADKIADQS